MNRNQFEKQLRKKELNSTALDAAIAYLFENYNVEETLEGNFNIILSKTSIVAFLNLVGKATPSAKQMLDMLEILGGEDATSFKKMAESYAHADDVRLMLARPELYPLYYILYLALVDGGMDGTNKSLKTIINYLRKNNLITHIPQSEFNDALDYASLQTATHTANFFLEVQGGREHIFARNPVIDIKSGMKNEVAAKALIDALTNTVSKGTNFDAAKLLADKQTAVHTKDLNWRNGATQIQDFSADIEMPMKLIEDEATAVKVPYGKGNISFRKQSYLNLLLSFDCLDDVIEVNLEKALAALMTLGYTKNWMANTKLYQYTIVYIIGRAKSIPYYDRLILIDSLLAASQNAITFETLGMGFRAVAAQEIDAKNIDIFQEFRREVYNPDLDGMDIRTHLETRSMAYYFARNNIPSKEYLHHLIYSHWEIDASDNELDMLLCVLYHHSLSHVSVETKYDDMLLIEELTNRVTEAEFAMAEMKQSSQDSAKVAGELRALEKKHEELSKRTKALEKDNRTANYELKKAQEENEALKEELAALKEYLEQVDALIDDEMDEIGEDEIILDNSTETIDEDIQFPYSLGKKVLFCGGHPNMVNKLASMFPDMRFIDGNIQNPTRAMLQGFDIAFLNINDTHRSYYRVKGALRKAGVPYYHINTGGHKKTAQIIVTKVKELELE